MRETAPFTSTALLKGAWVQLSWQEAKKVELILLYGSALRNRKVEEGRVILNREPEQTIPEIRFPTGPGEPAVIHFPESIGITSLRFEVSDLVDSAGAAGMSEIVALGKKK